MVYKVNRVGTPWFVAAPSQTVFEMEAGTIAGWDEDALSTLRRPVIPDPTVFQQFGVVKAFASGSSNLSVGFTVGFGQLVSAAEVANGNAVAAEFNAMVHGRMSSRFLLSHRVGLITTLPAGAWQRALTAPQPSILAVQELPPYATPVQQVRTWNTKSVAMAYAGDLDIKTAVVCHFVEITDTGGAGGPFAIDQLHVQLSYRGIHNADVLKPYDPVR